MSTLLTQNRKMVKSSLPGVKVYNFGIPAFRSKGNLATCPMAGACAAGCYAKSGAYLWSNVASAYERRLAATQSKAFIKDMSAEIAKLEGKVEKLYIRIHDSGDFYSNMYALKWLFIIRSFPNVQFYAYTKMVEMFKGISLPKNFTLIFSLGGKQDKLIDQVNDRHSKVFESIEELNAAGYVNASSNDLLAISINKKVGLVYHGAKSFKNTAWDRVTAANAVKKVG